MMATPTSHKPAAGWAQAPTELPGWPSEDQSNDPPGPCCAGSNTYSLTFTLATCGDVAKKHNNFVYADDTAT